MVVDPDTLGKGYGTAFVDYYEKYALEHNCPYLRMDTNERNSGARKLDKKLGYTEADIVSCVFNGIEGVSTGVSGEIYMKMIILFLNHNIRKCDILLRAHIEHGKNGRGYIEKSSQYTLFHFQKNSVLY